MVKKCILAIMMLCSVTSFAELSKKDQMKFEEITTKGVEFVASGKMIPRKLWSEYRKLLNALKAARKAEKDVRNQLRELINRAPDKEAELSLRLEEFTTNLKNIGKNVDKLNGDTVVLNEKMNVLYKRLIDLVNNLNKEFDRKIKRLREELLKDEGWAFGITMYGSSEYATSKEDLMPIGGAALTATWHKGITTMGLMLGAGVSVIDGAALSWTFIPSLLFDVFPKLSVGPALVVTQDLGNMEGADRMVYEVGPKIKTELFGTNFWGIPSFGIHGERGHGFNDPTYSFNVGFTAGIDFMFLK